MEPEPPAVLGEGFADVGPALVAGGNLAGGEVDDSLGDVGGAITDAFQVVRDPDEPGGALDVARVLVHKRQQLAEDLIVELVDLVIGVPNDSRQVVVALVQGGQAVAQHADGDVGHARDVDQWLERRIVAHADADLGDALGVVAHALKLGGHLHAGDQHAQVAGHGLLGRHDVDAQLLERQMPLVDVVVFLDDPARQLQVAQAERLDGTLDRLLNHAADEQEFILHVLELVFVFGPRRHGDPPS